MCTFKNLKEILKTWRKLAKNIWQPCQLINSVTAETPPNVRSAVNVYRKGYIKQQFHTRILLKNTQAPLVYLLRPDTTSTNPVSSLTNLPKQRCRHIQKNNLNHTNISWLIMYKITCKNPHTNQKLALYITWKELLSQSEQSSLPCAPTSNRAIFILGFVLQFIF